MIVKIISFSLLFILIGCNASKKNREDSLAIGYEIIDLGSCATLIPIKGHSSLTRIKENENFHLEEKVNICTSTLVFLDAHSEIKIRGSKNLVFSIFSSDEKKVYLLKID